MQDEVFESENTARLPDYEKTSYGKAAYRRVQRLRRKGRHRGIEVPLLEHELTKPEKPRIAFWIVAVVSAVLFVGILVGLGFLYNELIKAFSDLSGIVGFIKVMFKPDILRGSLGLSAFPAVLMIVIYLLIALLFALPFVAAIYFYRFVYNAFYMAKCSKEEFAKGSMISSRIFVLCTVLIVATILFAVLLPRISSAKAKLFMGLIFGGLFAALGGLLALMAVEKIKCGKWFASLEDGRKQNYLAHESALRRVKSRLHWEKRMWNDLGK